MNKDELNSRTEVIDFKAGVLFVQTEKGTYCVYGPEKRVMFGQECIDLAQDVFNEMVLGDLGKHVLNNETIGRNGFLISLNVEDTFYAIDFGQRQFVCSESLEAIEKIMNKGALERKDEVFNFEKQIMNDEIENTLEVAIVNKQKLYRVIDVYGNSYSSNNLTAAMYDLTRSREALSILKKGNGTIDLAFLNNYKMGPEMLNFRSVKGNSVIIKFKMNGEWEPEEHLSKKKFLGAISGVLMEVSLDCLEKNLVHSKEEELTIKLKRSL